MKRLALVLLDSTCFASGLFAIVAGLSVLIGCREMVAMGLGSVAAMAAFTTSATVGIFEV